MCEMEKSALLLNRHIHDEQEFPYLLNETDHIKPGFSYK